MKENARNHNQFSSFSNNHNGNEYTDHQRVEEEIEEQKDLGG
jgi:hypothetical protein